MASLSKLSKVTAHELRRAERRGTMLYILEKILQDTRSPIWAYSNGMSHLASGLKA